MFFINFRFVRWTTLEKAKVMSVERRMIKDVEHLREMERIRNTDFVSRWSSWRKLYRIVNNIFFLNKFKK
ncbi:hypothetical protein BMW23_0990 [Bodo saltans virus]|uniref:Uncharacterized protein n=1 Tax=Bodo saltans virus TaxID=2024608 RepID=A0A2H4UW20_9VIRU|nr:hypothetical protein QJ851_gp0972 [Bodo saltans virus]ATZ81035.1 hypothetical protein BMW23_0990 [Bodo saltans virus]